MISIYRFGISLSLVAAAFLGGIGKVKAQFTFSGKVEYERKINLNRLYQDNDWYQKTKGDGPAFRTSFFDLSFDSNSSFYQPGREVEANRNVWTNGTPAPENRVRMDLRTGQISAQKAIFDEKFLVEDSLKRQPWRITGEVRTIANHRCRKAVTKICDSVYVVAFYADDIPVSAGPESFGGLPGLILELAVPRLYTTWIATSVDVSPTTSPAPLPLKGKKTTTQKLAGDLLQSFKDWGKQRDQYLWWGAI